MPGIQISMEAEPLSLVFDGLEDSPGHYKTVPLSTETALDFAATIFEDRRVNDAIKLPGFLKRLVIRALCRAQEQARRDHWKRMLDKGGSEIGACGPSV